MKRIDLHVHSNKSDGTLSPSELAIKAHEVGLSAIALTDHDTVVGVHECQQVGAPLGLEVIPGIELSTDYHGKEIHILGLNLDLNNPILHETLKTFIKAREKRNQEMLEKLQALGFDLTEDDLGPHDQLAVIARPHFARAMMNKGYAQTMDEVFEKYITPGKPAYVQKAAPTFQTCIDLIHEVGGKAILAHPYIYKFVNHNPLPLLDELRYNGLDGVEVIYPKHYDPEVHRLTQYCTSHNLIITGGSDFHGDNKPQIQLGSGYGSTQVPYTLLEQFIEN
ncbi:MAG: PHP domain-containing protein [Niameybacter sp.]